MSGPACINCDAPGGYPYCSTGCEIADNPDDEFAPSAADMESEHYGLLVASFDPEAGVDGCIVTGTGLTDRRVLAAMSAYTRLTLGADDHHQLRVQLGDGSVTVAVTPTVFTRDGSGWTARRQDGAELAAWIS
ncbi:hypothetical protein OTB20_19455 [Streptomyces sp. H27-H1]|uniref:hypothetical protein n=1 Tax=Streptomyces sp. H27-H1 TaxID=2996461 RepID=UPI002271C5DC|nr:hypothetical protein [Streptomyces sp. H27-H1]MCY0928334.1 hypothetical protein [Streptomyces sp. H27-H1]